MRSKILGCLFFALLLLLIVMNFSKCNHANGDSTKAPKIQEPTIEYGIVTDSFQLLKGVIKPGQVLGEILYRNHIDHGKIDEIVKASKGVLM